MSDLIITPYLEQDVDNYWILRFAVTVKACKGFGAYLTVNEPEKITRTRWENFLQVITAKKSAALIRSKKLSLESVEGHVVVDTFDLDAPTNPSNLVDLEIPGGVFAPALKKAIGMMIKSGIWSN
jgi:hypothetical protein